MFYFSGKVVWHTAKHISGCSTAALDHKVTALAYKQLFFFSETHLSYFSPPEGDILGIVHNIKIAPFIVTKFWKDQ